MRFDALALAIVVGSTGLVAGQSRSAAAFSCQQAGGVARLREVPEGSGAAASRRFPGRVWTHNDSGASEVFALNEHGAVVARVRLTGVEVYDWEAIAVGPCPSGSCLFVADIGDNNTRRRRVSVYRVPEPEGTSAAVAVTDVFHGSYPDRPHDAETLLVTTGGDIFIVTKDTTALYRFPKNVRPGSAVALEPVGRPLDDNQRRATDRITDGAVSPNGQRVVLRTDRSLHFFDAANLLAGNWREDSRVSVAGLGEPQGEGVTFADDSTLVLVGEGGGGTAPGTFVRLKCR